MMYANALVDSFDFAADWRCVDLKTVDCGECHKYTFSNGKAVVVIEVDLLDPTDPTAAKVTKVFSVWAGDEDLSITSDDSTALEDFQYEDDMPF